MHKLATAVTARQTKDFRKIVVFSCAVVHIFYLDFIQRKEMQHEVGRDANASGRLEESIFANVKLIYVELFHGLIFRGAASCFLRICFESVMQDIC